MTSEKANQFAHALDGLIRSRTKGVGGEEYARKCIGLIADALTDPLTIDEIYARRDAEIATIHARYAKELA